MNQKINLPKALVGHSPWSASPTPIRVLSHYTIRRNLSHYPFPLSLSPRERATISDLLKDALLKCVPDTPLHLPISSLSQLDKSYLTEKFFWQDNLQRLPSEAKIYMPPSFAWQALLNGQDHLMLQCTSTDSNWSQPFRLLYDIEEKLSQNLKFGFTPQFGYLTSQFAHLGTGLSIQIFVHAPLLTHSQKLNDLLLKLMPEGLTATTLNRSPKRFLGDLIIFSNPYSIGKSESELASRLSSIAGEIEREEQDMRKSLKNHPTPEWIDRITKSYGLVSHSYQLTMPEALGALSPLKLAIDLGWLENISDPHINQLFFTMRRAHLQFEPRHKTSPDTSRALILKKAFAPTTLTI